MLITILEIRLFITPLCHDAAFAAVAIAFARMRVIFFAMSPHAPTDLRLMPCHHRFASLAVPLSAFHAYAADCAIATDAIAG